MSEKPPASLTKISLYGRCPRCGEGKLFKTFLRMHPACETCGLNFSVMEQGDGPAFFGICLIGALATILAAIMEIKYQPPFWVHAAVWTPFVVIGSLVCLRMAKAWLLGLQYYVKRDDFKN